MAQTVQARLGITAAFLEGFVDGALSVWDQVPDTVVSANPWSSFAWRMGRISALAAEDVDGNVKGRTAP